MKRADVYDDAESETIDSFNALKIELKTSFFIMEIGLKASGDIRTNKLRKSDILTSTFTITLVLFLRFYGYFVGYVKMVQK